MILALDLGTKTGWAAGVTHISKSGTENFAPGKFSGGGMRFLKFERWLDTWAAGDGLIEVIFEAVRKHHGVDAAHIYGGLLAVLTKWCEQRNIPYQGYPVGAIKKFATGNGNADKQRMIAAIQKQGFNPKDDNEADAIALWGLRMSQLPEGVLG